MQSLAAYDSETLQTRGVLADAWQLDPDGLWLRVHINPAARFSDGVPVTADDVRYTVMDFIKNERIEAERSRSTLEMIQDVEVIDEHTRSDVAVGACVWTSASEHTESGAHVRSSLTPPPWQARV